MIKWLRYIYLSFFFWMSEPGWSRLFDPHVRLIKWLTDWLAGSFTHSLTHSLTKSAAEEFLWQRLHSPNPQDWICGGEPRRGNSAWFLPGSLTPYLYTYLPRILHILHHQMPGRGGLPMFAKVKFTISIE